MKSKIDILIYERKVMLLEKMLKQVVVVVVVCLFSF